MCRMQFLLFAVVRNYIALTPTLTSKVQNLFVKENEKKLIAQHAGTSDNVYNCFVSFYFLANGEHNFGRNYNLINDPYNDT